LQINWQDCWSYIALLVAIADRRSSGVVRVATVVVITVPVAMTTAVVAVMVIVNAAVLILRRLSRSRLQAGRAGGLPARRLRAKWAAPTWS
jgi:hypothetical protein